MYGHLGSQWVTERIGKYMNDYIVYNKKDEVLILGNIKKCIKYLEVTENVFRTIVTRTLMNPNRNGYRIFNIDKMRCY